MRIIYKKHLVHSQWGKKEFIQRITWEVSHPGGEKSEKVKTTGVGIRWTISRIAK